MDGHDGQSSTGAAASSGSGGSAAPPAAVAAVELDDVPEQGHVVLAGSQAKHLLTDEIQQLDSGQA